MKVNVYLSYYNGSKYFDEQINSLLNQKDVDIRIFIRDDGSNESEAAFLEKYCDNNQIMIMHGENEGFGKSFMQLVSCTKEKADFYAFCDQDDVWLDFKLKVACEKIKSRSGPVAYSAQPKYVNSKLEPLDEFGTIVDTIHFGEMNVYDALEYHLFGIGCTFVWNNALNDILKKIDLKCFSFSHDNFLSVLTPFVGFFYRDSLQSILYRQHGGNVSGNKKKRKSLFQKFQSKIKNFNGQANFRMRKYILENAGCFICTKKLELLKISVEYRGNIIKKIKLMMHFLLDSVDRKKKIKNLLMILGNKY